MKTSFVAPVIASISATAASAGSVVFSPAVDNIIVEEAPMGSSGAWIIPLIAIGLVLLATNGNDEPEATATTITRIPLSTF